MSPFPPAAYNFADLFNTYAFFPKTGIAAGAHKIYRLEHVFQKEGSAEGI